VFGPGEAPCQAGPFGATIARQEVPMPWSLIGAAFAWSALGAQVAAPLAASARAREAAVFEAAFRQQIEEHLDETARARGTVVCVAIDPGGAPQSPGLDFMKRLADEPAVRRAAGCDPRPSGAVEAMTLRPAIIVTAGPIDWVADDEAWIAVRYFRNARQSALRRYRVVRERQGWVSLGPILLDGPV